MGRHVGDQIEISFGMDLPESCDPRVRRVYEYWRSIHPATGGLPGRQHLEPLDLADVLRWLWLVDVAREPIRFRYRLVGTGHVQALGRDLTGQWLDEAHEGFGAMISSGEFATGAAGKLCFSRRRPQFRVDPDYAVFERVLLPLARDGTLVDMLLGISVYRRGDGSVVL